MEYEKPDVLWFFRLNSVWASGCDRYDVPVIGDMDDFESRAHYRGIRLLPRAKRIAAMFDYPLFVRAQRAAAQTCDLVLVANSGDVDSVSAMTGRRVRHAPNGFDYSTPPDFEQVRAPRIVFYGSLGYEPNIDGLRWFVREVWPQVRAAFPGVRMEIAGKPTAEAQTFASEPDIHLCGFVQSIPSFVTGGALLVVPLRSGSGTRIKVLEAWALGLPVVSTSVGCEGLDAVDGETALIADDPHRFAQACIDLLCSPDRGQTMARQAYEFAKERFDWLTLAPGLEDAVASVTRTGRASGGGQVAR
ncbi:MAG: glycosyltransferase family 4 protein [Actinobacteria bacterium]|nr:glycosyltransferase family 4 protein [Actinomycetota bacterium]